MSNTEKTPAWALDNVRFTSDAGDNLTCREYLCALLKTLWREGEGFSGKRPFGNSGWDYDLIDALVSGGCVPEGGDGDAFVLDMIAEMRQGVGA